ncbi:MAG: YDG domain-containing protein, partial [Oscillospiraceae bacterium]
VGNDTMADATGDVSVTLLPKPLTAKALNSHSRVYDGSRDFVNVPLVLTGVLGQDTVTATANGTTASTDAGTPAFTASSITFGGENADYYTLAPADVSGNVSITPKPVTVTVTAQNKVYDGTTTAPVTYTVIGKIDTDDVTATGTANFANKTVGIGKTVTVDSIGLSGTKEDNYSLTPPGTITTAAAITKRTIAWDKAGTVKTKEYDTTNSATVATAPTLIGVVERDAVTVTNGTVTFANANAGTHAITAMGFGIEGTDKDNYIAPAGQPTFAKGTITAKTVKNPTISIATSHTFNGKQQIPIFTVKDGATDGATVIPATDYTVTYGTNVNAGTDAGSVTVNLKGNYSGNAIAKFTIQKADGPSATTKPILMKAGAEIAYSIPLPAISNAGTVTYTVAPITNSIFSVSPHVNQINKTLEFTSA